MLASQATNAARTAARTLGIAGPLTRRPATAISGARLIPAPRNAMAFGVKTEVPPLSESDKKWKLWTDYWTIISDKNRKGVVEDMTYFHKKHKDTLETSLPELIGLSHEQAGEMIVTLCTNYRDPMALQRVFDCIGKDFEESMPPDLLKRLSGKEPDDKSDHLATPDLSA